MSFDDIHFIEWIELPYTEYFGIIHKSLCLGENFYGFLLFLWLGHIFSFLRVFILLWFVHLKKKKERAISASLCGLASCTEKHWPVICGPFEPLWEWIISELPHAISRSDSLPGSFSWPCNLLFPFVFLHTVSGSPVPLTTDLPFVPRGF